MLNWHGIGIFANGNKTTWKFRCLSCKEKCVIRISISDDPPQECLKEGGRTNGNKIIPESMH